MFTAFRAILYSCVLLTLWQQFREGIHVSVYILLAIQCTVSPFRLLDRGMQIDHKVQLCFFSPIYWIHHTLLTTRYSSSVQCH